jgi:hypothetical protein
MRETKLSAEQRAASRLLAVSQSTNFAANLDLSLGTTEV